MTSSRESRQLMEERLRALPVEELKEILSNQLDLEVRLKHKELELTHEEMSKIEAQMIVLRKFFDVPNDLKLSQEPSDFTTRYINTLNKSLAFTYNDLKNLNGNLNPVTNYQHFNSNFVDGTDAFGTMAPEPSPSFHGYRTRSTTSSLRPSSASLALAAGSSGSASGASSAAPAAGTPAAGGWAKANANLGCLYRRTDGIIVRLICPDCQRSNFSSAQGFLNHSRIAHSKEYTSQDAAALKCGEILPVIKQDAEGEASLQSLVRKNLDPSKNLNVNEIYFDGLSNTLNTVHDSVAGAKKSRSASLSGPGKTSRSASESAGSGKPSVSPSPGHEEESILMKKLVRDSKMKKEDFTQLVEETREPVENSHLFSNEVEDSEGAEEEVPAVSEMQTRAKRRTSRGGINIRRSSPEDAKRRRK